MGLVGWTRRVRETNISLHIHAARRLGFKLSLESPQYEWEWVRTCQWKRLRQWPHSKARPFRIRLLALLSLLQWVLQATYSISLLTLFKRLLQAPYSGPLLPLQAAHSISLFALLERPLGQRLLQIVYPLTTSNPPQPSTSELLNLIPPHLPAPQHRKIRPPNLLHPSRPLTNSQIPHPLHLLRQHLDHVPPPLRNQHLLLRLRLTSLALLRRRRKQEYPRKPQHQRSPDGLHRSRLPAPHNWTSLLPHALQHRSLRALPRFPTLRARVLVARTRHAYFPSCRRGRRRRGLDSRPWRRWGWVLGLAVEIRLAGRGYRLVGNGSGDGGL